MAASLRPSQRNARTFYFLFFASIASLMPFLVVYYERLGLSGGQIGVLSAMFPFATLTIGPVWGALADALGRHRAVAVVAFFGAGASGLAISLGTDFVSLVPWVAAFAVFMAPVIPLTDTAVLAGLRGERERYGRLRLWGGVGFGLSSLAAGVAVDRFGLGYSFSAFAVLLGLAALAGARLAWRAVATERADERASAGDVPRGLAFFRPFLTGRWIALLAAGILGGAALAPTTTFLYLYLAERGAAVGAIGVALAIATVSEIPVMFLASRWMQRVRPRVLLLTALGVFAVRALLYGTLDTTAGLVAVQLLHGPSFALLVVAGVGRADRLAVPGRRATGQSLFTASLMGMGGVIGSLGGGALYGALGPQRTYLIVAGTLAVATALLASWRFDDA